MASNISDTRPLSSSSNLKGSFPTASSSLGIPSSTTSSTTPSTTTATSMVPPLSTTSVSSTGIPEAMPALSADVIWRWVDHVMRKERGQSAVSWTSLKGIEDPSTDFADGIRLIRLIETLSGHRATGPFHLSTTSGGLDEFDSVDNIRMAFRMLRSEGLEPGFKPAYLYRPGPQRQHLLTDLLWRIMLHFRFYQHAIGTRGATSYSPEEKMNVIRQNLLDWVRDKTSRHVDNLRMKRIENLSSGWDDGMIYLILLHEYDPSIVTHDDLRNYSLPGQRARSLATSLSLAKRHLGIPKLISSPEGILDENSNIAFLCEFWYKFYQHEGYGDQHPGTRGVEQREYPRQEPRLYREGGFQREPHEGQYREGLARSTGGIQQREYPRQDRLYREGGLASSERGLPYHEEERLRADQMRLEADTERKRAEEERYKAMEAKRKAEADRHAAEQEAKRALDRREMALREKERLEAERRIADDERRQAMEAVRRAEVDRLRVEQERKHLEDEVRRAEERARAEDIRRYAQVKMEEADRDRFRAQEERRLAREEMLLADHELKLAEEERRRADMEMRLAESERLRASREGLYTSEARALPPSPAQTTVRVVPTHPVATPVVTTQTVPVTHQAPISSVTTHPVSIEEKKRRKAEKKARRAQEDLSQAEKLRRKEEKRRLRAEADRKRLEDYVVMTQNVLIGVLQMSVIEARGMGRGIHKPYAKVKLEKQKMKTKTIKKTLIPQWRSDFKLYHSDPDAILKVRVYDKGGRFGGKRFIGRVDIPARDLEDGVEQDLWYPLHYKTAQEKKLRAKEKRKREKERYKGWVPEEVRAWRGEEPLGEIHLRLMYRKDPLYTKPGIYNK